MIARTEVVHGAARVAGRSREVTPGEGLAAPGALWYCPRMTDTQRRRFVDRVAVVTGAAAASDARPPCASRPRAPGSPVVDRSREGADETCAS
jgi:hypothetical protein